MALIGALVVVVLATSAAVAMAERQQVELRRAENLTLGAQAMRHVQGVETWALAVLAADARRNQRDDAGDEWARPLPPTAVPGGEVAGTIEDLGGRLNLNDLIREDEPDPAQVERLRRLLAHLGLNPAMAMAVVDWIDSDLDTSGPDGAEDGYYSRLDPPYRSANRPMAHEGELSFVRGFDPAVLSRLLPHVCAVPAGSAINVNLATGPVLASLGRETEPDVLQSLLAGRPYPTVVDFISALVAAGVEGLEADGLAVTSNHFRVASHVRLGHVSLRVDSDIERIGGVPRLLRRQFQGDDDA
jgi:general secretion pathway protein K